MAGEPASERVAEACDRVFPEMRGWFTDYYTELQTWSEVPAAFKDWSAIESNARHLRDWWPSIVSGLLQTEPYARALLSTYPGVAADTVSARQASRMERQRRLFSRDVSALFIVDELSLYRLTGSAEVMAGQMRRLPEVAAMPDITVQVLPAVANPGVSPGFILTDDSAYAEHTAGGFAYPTGETVTALAKIFDTLRGECKSSFPGANGGACVEVADDSDALLVRDTTDRGGTTLSIPAQAWEKFTTSLR